MKAICGENSLQITLSKGVVFTTTPTLLSSVLEHRVIPFAMIKEKRGNWKDVKDWFERVLGWKIDFKDTNPIDIQKELSLIEKFLKRGFNPNVRIKEAE